MDRKWVMLFFAPFAFLSGCGRQSSLFSPDTHLIYTDSSVIFKFNLTTQKKDTVCVMNESFVSSLQKVNDSLVTISISCDHTYCLKDLIALETTNHYSHEEFFDIYDSHANDTLFFIVDTTHHYYININNSKIIRYRTDILTEIMSAVPIAGWNGMPIHPNVPKEGYYMTNCFYNLIGDTTKFYSYTRNDPNYHDMEDYFIESEFHCNRRVFTRKGDLYLQTYWRTDILRKNPRNQWRYWSGDGAFDPSLSHDGRKTVFRCLNGQHRNFRDGRVAIGDTGIYELNINTRELKLVIDHYYENPEYSPDDKYLLLYDHNTYLHNYTFLIYNLTTKEINTVAYGNHCIWF